MDGLAGIVGLSLAVSAVATLIATLFGIGLATVLALTSFPGRSAVLTLINALLGLPPVVVGLILYLLLSRSGPLGSLGLLFTPAAMVLAQAVLALPIIAALAFRALHSAWRRFGPDLQACGASRWRAFPELLRLQRRALATAILAGFGRSISEVGAILIVGGNIDGFTRSMTTAIALETSKGNLAMALGLGGVLIAISVCVSACVLVLTGRLDR